MTSLINKDERIFIAGASGMVGSSVYRILRKYNYGNHKFGGAILTPNRKELDLLNQKEVNNWFKKNKPSIVILAAGKVGGIYANSKAPADFLLENLKIQINIIDSAKEFNVKRLLFLGSSCIYPKYADQPIEEDSLLESSLEPTNEWYAIAKIAGLKLCSALRIQNGFDSISLMPTNLYGPNDNYDLNNSHVIAALIRKFCEAKQNSNPIVTCWGSGTPLREFLHVDDLSEAIIFCLEKWDPKSKNAPIDKYGNPLFYLNVGTGQDLSIRELSFKIAKAASFEGEIIWDKSKPDGTPKKQLNTTKIRNLGWEPKIKLDDGLKRTIEDFKLTQQTFINHPL